MKKFQGFDTFGELNHGFHEGTSLLIHTKNEQLVIYDFNKLNEIARTTFKQPIVRTLIPVMNKQLSFRGVVVTEDQMAHLIVLKQNALKKSASYDLGQKLTLNFTLLLDAQLHSYVFFENGLIALISQKLCEKKNTLWPPKSMIRIHRLVPYNQFEGEDLLSNNSAGFFSYHYVGDACHITSWIIKFPSKSIINGPFSIQINPNSVFLSPYFFLHGNDVYSVKRLEKIGQLPNAYCCSTYLGDSAIVSDSEGHLYKITHKKIEKLRELSAPPLRLEYNGEKYIYLTANGLINDKLNIGASFPLTDWAGIFVSGGFPRVLPVPLVSAPQPKVSAIKIEEKLVTSNSGGKWTPPHKIVASNSIRVGQYDFFVVATAGTVHILKSHLKNPSILPITEFNWEHPVSAVAINSKLFAVACVEKKIKVQQYSGDEYSFSFESNLCLCLSLSETTLACGFSDGSFILTSLKEKTQLLSVRPFRIPVYGVTHCDEDTTIVQWGNAVGKLSPKTTEWIRLPSFSGSLTSVLGKQGILSLATPTSVDVFSFADQQLMAKIPQRAVGMCVNNRKTYILTIKNEVVVLHYHSSLKIEAQFVVNVDNPYAILASNDIIYILCQKCICLFDKSGKKIEDIELDTNPKYYDLSSKGIYLVMYRSIWFVEKKDSIKKISIDFTNISAFSVADENRFVVAASGKFYFCDNSGSKPSFSALAKYDKPILGIRCYSSLIGGKNDSLFALYNDHTSNKWQIPAPKENK
ncbi:hypothetical protein TRFO_23587 [Tritrichomonas foetus]|uniref:Uncharacterized protein n=1 Tax=Tritrichomonas foetus TaxID=1144522 RepID=A0A1J4KAR6_9EUKA|nr:hypothetical protein TRFO_23587 [Tritrichomonas foetus]|eukprot:OHT08050.1 hypothetical protein TRFO_23587 [Tritrichomonas foetus]